MRGHYQPAVEAADSVDALLLAVIHSRFAFVHVFTGAAIVAQLEARVTGADESSGHVSAALCARFGLGGLAFVQFSTSATLHQGAGWARARVQFIACFIIRCADLKYKRQSKLIQQNRVRRI